MKPVTRRSVMAGAAAVAVVPVVGLGKGAKAAPGEDRPLQLLHQYRRELAIIDSMDDPSQRQITAWQRKADRILKEAASLPFLTAASVVVLLDIVIMDDLLHDSSLFSNHFAAMMDSARDYLARKVAS